MPEEKQKLFRETSLKAIQSPEQMDNSLKVTSPGIWVVLAAVVSLLVGVILWGIFGSIDTHCDVAVVSASGQAYCVVPYDKVDSIVAAGEVIVDGRVYALSGSMSEAVTVTESMDMYTRLAGNLEIGDIVIGIVLSQTPPDGVYTGTVVTEKLQPISLLLQ